MDELKKLIDKRNKALADMRAIKNAADEAKRELSKEELERMDKFDQEYELLQKNIDSITQLRERERANAELNSNVDEALSKDIKDPAVAQMRALGNYFRTADPQYRAEIVKLEKRDLQLSPQSQGGFWAPEGFMNQLISNLNDEVIIRSLATIIPMTSFEILNVPTNPTKASDAQWTSELGPALTDSQIKAGLRKFVAHKLMKEILASDDLISFSAIDIVAYVLGEFQRLFAETMENAYTTGNGVNQPLGVFFASAAGIPTSRDVLSGASGALTTDGFISIQDNVKEGYQKNAVWLMHRLIASAARKLKDDNDQYLWQPNVQAAEPPLFLGKPVRKSEFAPSTLSDGDYFTVYGDFSSYHIYDAMALKMKVLDQIAARTAQVSYISSYNGDGQPVRAEAFSRGKVGA